MLILDAGAMICYSLFILVPYLVVINAQIAHISMIGFGNFVPCSSYNSSKHLIWFSKFNQIGNSFSSFYECDLLSQRYRHSYPQTIKKLQQRIKGNLTNDINTPVIVCAVLSETLWPKLTWIINSQKAQVVDTKDFLSGQTFKNLFVVVSFLPVSNDTTTYECKIDVPEICTRDNHPAKLLKLNYSAFDSSNNSVYQLEPRLKKKLNYSLPAGKCRMAPSNFCEPLGQHSNSLKKREVYVMNKFNLSLRVIEEQLATNITNLLQSSESLCYRRLKEMACFYLFPICTKLENEANYENKRYLPVCREQCNKLSLIECKEDWPVIEQRFAQIMKAFNVEWVGCSNLPTIRSVRKSCWTSLYKQKWEPKKQIRNCYREYDRHYVGRLNRTKAGIQCQRWDSLCPHDHKFWPEFYPELHNAENYCRNPDGKKSPWCFTTKTSHYWDYCSLPLCSENENQQQHDTVLIRNNNKENSIAKSISIVFLSLIGFIVCTAICYIYYRYRYNNFRRESMSTNVNFQVSGSTYEMIELNQDLSKCCLPQNEIYHRLTMDTDIFGRLNSDVVSKLRALEFPRNELVHLRTLAEGGDKIIYQATAKENGSFNLPKNFVIKSLRMDSSKKQTDDLCMEALALLDFQHDNVVRLLAICFHGRPLCICLEFMPCCDLQHFLQNCASPTLNDDAEYCNLYPRGELKLTETDLWSMALQIACGMQYVTSLRYIHRDLAARNCLLDANLKIKISDFGMCRRLHYDEQFFVGDFDEDVAIRWAAPEVHRHRRFSIYSDVWSFGVLLWEMCTFGFQPYFGKSNLQVVKLVCDGSKLDKPDVASDDLFALMLRCWDNSPSKRPDFVEIYRYLKNDLS